MNDRYPASGLNSKGESFPSPLYDALEWDGDGKKRLTFTIKRLPVCLTFAKNCFNALYHGIPESEYTESEYTKMTREMNYGRR